jgi:hypothetical protein
LKTDGIKKLSELATAVREVDGRFAPGTSPGPGRPIGRSSREARKANQVEAAIRSDESRLKSLVKELLSIVVAEREEAHKRNQKKKRYYTYLIKAIALLFEAKEIHRLKDCPTLINKMIPRLD